MAVRRNQIPQLTLREVSRFLSKITYGKINACWIWNGSTSKTNQYGSFNISRFGKTIPIGPHCLSWEIFNGKIPIGKLVRHSCDNPTCVNPNHLTLGTDVDNKRDSIIRNRAVLIHSPLGREKISRIRNLCSLGNKQDYVASVVGVDQSTVSRIVNRKRNYANE